MDELARCAEIEAEEVYPILIVDPEKIASAIVEEVDRKGGVAYIFDWEISVDFYFSERRRLEVTREGVFFSHHHVIYRPQLVTGDRIGCDFLGNGESSIFRWCCWADLIAAWTEEKLFHRLQETG